MNANNRSKKVAEFDENTSFASRVIVIVVETKRKQRTKTVVWEYDTWGSRVITDLSTNQACGCLTSQIGPDVVLSTKCGRTQDMHTSLLNDV